MSFSACRSCYWFIYGIQIYSNTFGHYTKLIPIKKSNHDLCDQRLCFRCSSCDKRQITLSQRFLQTLHGFARKQNEIRKTTADLTQPNEVQVCWFTSLVQMKTLESAEIEYSNFQICKWCFHSESSRRSSADSWIHLNPLPSRDYLRQSS